MAKAWKTISWESCDRCGDDVEVLTTADGPDMVYDSDEARCVACRCPGNVSCDGESCYIVWHSDADCDCRYCRYWAELDALREENEQLKRKIDDEEQQKITTRDTYDEEADIALLEQMNG